MNTRVRVCAIGLFITVIGIAGIWIGLAELAAPPIGPNNLMRGWGVLGGLCVMCVGLVAFIIGIRGPDEQGEW